MKKTFVFLAVVAIIVLTAASAFAAAGDSTQNTGDLSKYEAPVYADPVVDATTGNTVLTVTNKYYPELVDVSVSKIWDDDDDRDHFRPAYICITLTAMANEGDIEEEVWNYSLSIADANASDENQWDHTFENLVKFYDGYQIAYTVAEDEGQCQAQVVKTEDNCEISGGRWENGACTPFSLYAPNNQNPDPNPDPNPTPDYSAMDQTACAAAEPAGVWHAAVCSDPAYTDQVACEAESGTWTPGFCAAN